MNSSLGIIGLLGLLLSGGLLGGGLPLGIPPAEHDVIIDHVAPENCLAYVAWNGTAAPSAESSNRTEQLLAEPELVRLTSQLVNAFKTAFRRSGGPSNDIQHTASEVLSLVQIVATSPTAIYIDAPAPLPSVGFVCRVGDRADDVEALMAQVELAMAEEAGFVVEKDGVAIHNWPVASGAPPLQWGIVDDCLVVAFGPDEFAKLVKRRDAASTPAWLTNLHKRLPVGRLANVVHLNTAAILENAGPVLQAEPQVQVVIKALGLDRMLSYSCVTGLDKEACLSRTWIHVDGPAKGLTKFLNVKPLQAVELDVVPADSTIAAAFRLDLADGFRTIQEIAEDVEVGASRHMNSELAAMEFAFGIKLEDALKAVGDSWRIYQSEEEGGRLLTGWTAVVSVRDAGKLRDISNLFRGFLAAQNANVRSSRQARIQTFNAGDKEIFFTNFVGAELPVAPAWCITDDELVISLLPQGVTAYLNRAASVDKLTHATSGVHPLPANSVAMLHYDEKVLFETAYPALLMGVNVFLADLQQQGVDVNISMLPSAPVVSRHLQAASINVLNVEDGVEIVSRRTLPVVVESVGAVLPAFFVMGTRSMPFSRRSGSASPLARLLSPTAARRDTSKNNMKQLMLAHHNFHDVHNHFPAAVNNDKDGKPGLSWRVHLLPFLDQAPLFNAFHLDEPWDSEHNKKLVRMMPAVFRSPGSRADQFKTNYVGLRNENSMLSGDTGVRIRDTTDGTANTFMFVEADDEHAVIWTRPDDLVFDPEHPAAGLVSPSLLSGFLAAMTDASIRVISADIDLQVLERLVIRNDGNVIGEFQGN